MAVAAGAVDVERRARVDPHLQAVAVFESFVAAPHRLLLAVDADVEQQAFVRSRQSAHRRIAVRGRACSASSSARFSRRYDSSSSTPPAFQIGIMPQHRHGKAEQETAGRAACFQCRAW